MNLTQEEIQRIKREIAIHKRGILGMYKDLYNNEKSYFTESDVKNGIKSVKRTIQELENRLKYG